MNKIHNLKSIESAVFRISCGEKNGTTFLVDTEDDRQILLTSNHTLSDAENNDICIQLENGSLILASILIQIPEKDVAVIEINSSISNSTSLPLRSELVAYNAEWETFGFPAERINAGARFNGSISRTNEGTKWDIDLECTQYNNLADFEGLSGSPLIVGGYVAGIIGYDITGGLGATSILSIEEKLLEIDITFFKDNFNSVPISIEDELPQTTPNTEVFDKIEETVSERKNSSYFLVSGNPGSGKTTIAAQIEFTQKEFVICDRYFVKVPEPENIPTEIRATPEYFTKWIEEVYCRILYNRPPDKPKENAKPYERILEIREGLSMLANHYRSKATTGFLIIDGLDDVPQNVLENFLSILPNSLSDGLKIIFSCTSRKVLSASLQSQISPEDEIKVTPLSLEKAESYLSEQLAFKNIPYSKIQELAVKSEGHPLYLRYLAKYVAGMKDISNLEGWINTIPVIHGEIEKYYNKIWQQIENGNNEIWLAGTLSRIRIPIENEELFNLLPNAAQQSFPIAFGKIQHLLKEDNRLSIYHTSFSDFVKSKTIAIGKEIHDNVANYCTKKESSFLTVSEMIYHLSKGNKTQEALKLCNQDWVDKCATFSVSPDMVVADIRRVIALAAELGIAHKVIELLLLSQRVNFRYNILFDENATYLVNALLALGKFDEALRYVVRNKTLVVEDGDALYLLQRFYEYEADQQAEVLLQTIKKTCTAIFENGFDSDSFNRYTRLRFSAISLSSNAYFKEAYEEFGHLKEIVLKMITKSGNSKEVLHKFKDDIGSYNMGYYIWRFNVAPVTKIVEEQGLYKFDDKSSGYTALCIYQALHFGEISPITVEEDNISAWTTDLEYLIDTYGIHEDYYLYALYVLIRYSQRADIIEQLFKELFKEAPSSSFRQENAVDYDRRGIDKFLLYSECQGYLNLTDGFPKIAPYYYNNWEIAVSTRFALLGFINGRARRLHLNPNEALMRPIKDELISFLAIATPDLRQRIDWKRSYGLPEDIFPVLYDKVVEVLFEFFPDLITTFVQDIKDKKKYQLGLYTEGYTDSLLGILRKFARNGEYYEEAFQVAKVLENHVIKTVENRWERNEYLLRLVQLYAQIENVDKANEMFSEMINYSMGPSWYKEAQLGIINTAVSSILPQIGRMETIQKFAAHLHHASGEMTFQRYVKQQQEEFVGDLAKVGFLDKAINYFKYLILPDYHTVIDNAESSLIDMPSTGQGYVLGARAIEEQSGILDLLAGLDVGSSHMAYALTELFIIGDDRYLSGFVKIQAKILNESKTTDLEATSSLINRIVRFYIAEVGEEFRNDYLSTLAKKLKPEILLMLKQELILANVDIKGLDELEEPEKPPVETSLDILDSLPEIKRQAESKLRSENKSGARKLVVEALEKVQKEKYGIWPSYYSGNINELRNTLGDTYSNSTELIKAIQNLIINEARHEEWVVADSLIKILRNIDDDEEKQKILNAVEQHIFLMVRTPKEVIEKYDFLADERSSDLEMDHSLLKLLIWFLNHPSLVLKNRTMEILAWLGKQQPKQVISALVDEMLSDGYYLSKELSAAIIHQIADASPVLFFPVFELILEEKTEQISQIKHFMIQNSLIDTLCSVKRQTDFEPTAWVEKLERCFKEAKGNHGDVEFDEDYLSVFDSELYNLNELGILNKEFAVDFIGLIDRYCPLTIPDSIKASRYIDRSFNNYNDIQLVPDFENIIRFALNTAISPHVPRTERNKTADILRFYQPTFPENNLIVRLVHESDFSNWFNLLFSEGSDGWDSMFDGENAIIHYYDKTYSHAKRDYDEVEVVAYLVPLTEFDKGNHYFPWETYRSNGYPADKTEPTESGIIPLVITSDNSGTVTGSEVVLSYPNTSFIETINLEKEDKPKKAYWRNGRNWEQKRLGASERTGYSVSIPKHVIERFRDKYKLIWDIDYNFKTIRIDVFDKKIIE